MEQISPQAYKQNLQESKMRIAQELGIQLNIGGDNGHLTSRDAGRIGGRMGGRIGGEMVRRMVVYAENHLKENGQL
jgi:hypothetical protein